MRGADADSDAAFVRETALTWELPVEIGSRDVPELARRSGLSLEEAGRAARYRFFGRAARRTGCTRIATGHTADDRAETVLLHLFRGTGLDGLAGIPARRPLRPDRGHPEVVRPLTDVTRAQVLDYAARYALQPRHDATNDSPDFLRNRVRRALLPLLEAEYSPALRRHLLRLADLAEEETSLLNAQARELLARAAVGGSSLRLSRGILLKAPPVLVRRALRLAVRSLQPGPPPEWETVERLFSLLRGARPGFMLPGGLITARLTDEALTFARVDPTRPFLDSDEITLALPGSTSLPWAEGVMTAVVVGSDGWSLTAGGRPCLATPAPGIRALLDLSRVTGLLAARPPRPGDRIQPLGMNGHRKLQDLFTDQKVPRSDRRRLPVVCDAERIVWVIGCCVSESVKVTEQTTSVLLLAWEPGR